MTLAPIVLFVYNRPWHTKQTIEALQKNELASESELFIFSDAAKNEQSIENVKEVRNYINQIDGFKKITIIERETNFGLANSIIDGVTNIVNEYDKIIVLEDDLVTSPYFLKFMNEALEQYQNEPKVFGVTGYAYPIKSDNLSTTFFLKDEGCWSWGTWGRAWKHFEKDTNNLIGAIVDANETRKEFVTNQILIKNPQVVGIYRLIMKSGSDNFRSSAVQGIIKKLQTKNIKIVIYEPVLKDVEFEGLKVIKNLNEFKTISDVIVANRLEDTLSDIKDKVYTRDIFNSDS